MGPDPVLLTLATALEACAQALRALEPTAPVAPAAPGPVVPSLLTVAQLCAKHPALRPRTVYTWLAARAANGLADAIIHPHDTGRLLIDEAAFFRWLERYREQARGRPDAVLRLPVSPRRRRARP